MMDRNRRNALGLAAVMGGVSLLTAMTRLVTPVRVAGPTIDLDLIVPEQFDGWRVDEATSVFVRPAERGGRQYGIYDQVLERAFVDGDGHRVMLSVAYGSEQSNSLQLHRPELCYRFNGYQVQGLRAREVTLAGSQVPVIDLEAEMPGRTEPVTYWMVIGGKPVTDPRAANWRLISFTLRGQLPDGMLVRVSSIGSDTLAAFALHRRFADSMLRAMAPENRERMIGMPVGG